MHLLAEVPGRFVSHRALRRPGRLQKRLLTKRLAESSRTAALLNARYSGDLLPDEQDEACLLHSATRTRLLLEKARLDRYQQQLSGGTEAVLATSCHMYVS